ncbi:hypothetical protein EV702DRAFT_1041938 [Suillus placidus]|uniref:KOW domain-containing protein n=1 Tax=Suillus placidus TaxID=48579 RepID=A0A9P7D726_9AGAM|nr:hypothetical protein EV702DRAFT_1041938 [Suillus placidus]
MSKRAASESHDDEPTSKRIRSHEDNRDESAITAGRSRRMAHSGTMEAAFASYLGNRYDTDDWKEARDALFSGDGDDCLALANLLALKARHIPQGASSTSTVVTLRKDSAISTAAPKAAVRLKSARVRRPKNPFIDDEASDDDDVEEEDEEEEEEEEEEENSQVEGDDGPSVRSLNVTRLPGLSSAKDKLSAAIDHIFDRMYLLHVHRSATQRVAEHLRSNGVAVTVSPWIPGQLYAVSDSPRTIATTLNLLSSSVKDYTHISEEERAAVERSRSTLPNPGWVKITQGKYKGDIGYVFDPKQLNDFVTDDKVVGWSYKGERYYMGLLQKNFRRDGLELVASPHANDIRLHLQSGSCAVGDSARPITGEVCQEICTVVSTNHASGSACLKFILDGHGQELEFRLQDIERVFWVGDTVRVVAGAYAGLEGHIIKKSEDLFHVEVSKYYLDRRPLTHVLQSRLPMQPDYDPLPEPESLQIGDEIEVCAGEYMGKCGIVVWFPIGGTTLWFRAEGNIKDELINAPTAFVQRIRPFKTLQFTKERGYDVKPGDVVIVARGPEFQTQGVVQAVDFANARLTLISEGDYSLVNVPIGFTMKLSNVNPDSFRDIIGKEVFIIGGARKGYRATLYQLAHDTCSVSVHGQARTTVKREDVATRYGMRLNGAILEGPDMISFCEMQKKSYIMIMPPCRSKTPPPDPIVPSSSSMDPSSSEWSNWSSHNNHDSADSLGVKTYDPWVATNAEDIEDAIADIKEKSRNGSPLPWLMNKEFALKLTRHHVVLKVSPSFMGGRLHNRFVSTACPDPFCGENGPAPDGCVAVFCTSNGAGAALQHYHIPISDLSPAPLRKKNQKCLVLDGDTRGEIMTVAKCNMKKNTVEIAITARISFTLRFDQICLVEESRFR